jgi:hypothetical protein
MPLNADPDDFTVWDEEINKYRSCCEVKWVEGDGGWEWVPSEGQALKTVEAVWKVKAGR